MLEPSMDRLLDRITIQSWLLDQFPDDDTVIRAIHEGELHDPRVGYEEDGLLSGAYYYHNEGHLPFQIACMAKLGEEYIGIAVITNAKHPRIHTYVKIPYRRNGVGRALLDALAQRFPLRSQGYRGLYTGLSNRLYDSFGIADSRMYPVSIGLGQDTVEVPFGEPIRLNFAFNAAAWEG